MTATYGTIARTAYGSRSNTVTSVPASTANGDLLILVAITGNATVVPITLPAGFTAIGSAQAGADSVSYDWHAVMGYRIASSEPANYTCTHATADSETMMIRIDGSGTLSVDVFSQAHTAGQDFTSIATSVTPTATDDLLLFLSLNWDFVGMSPPTGMTEQHDSEFIYLATEALASSSATGTRTQAHPNSPWFANLIAIKDAVGGGSTTLTADAGSYTLTGSTAAGAYVMPLGAAGAF